MVLVSLRMAAQLHRCHDPDLLHMICRPPNLSHYQGQVRLVLVPYLGTLSSLVHYRLASGQCYLLSDGCDQESECKPPHQRVCVPVRPFWRFCCESRCRKSDFPEVNNVLRDKNRFYQLREVGSSSERRKVIQDEDGHYNRSSSL